MRTLTTAVAVLLTAAAASSGFAQNQELSEDQVRGFLSDTTEQAEQLVKDRNWSELRDWARTHVADNAQFAMKGALISQNMGTFTYAGTLSGQQVQQMAAGGMMGARGLIQAIEDYRLETDIRAINILPNGEATALVQFVESGRIDPSRMAQGPSGEDEAREGRSAVGENQKDAPEELVFQAVSNCDMRLTGAGEENIRISIAACETTTTF